MPDLEKVIKGLECCINAGDCQNQCDYWPDNRCEHLMMIDALELLKAQEAVKPVIKPVSKPKSTECTQWYACGKCGKSLDPEDKYCRRCGRAVKWDG